MDSVPTSAWDVHESPASSKQMFCAPPSPICNRAEWSLNGCDESPITWKQDGVSYGGRRCVPSS